MCAGANLFYNLQLFHEKSMPKVQAHKHKQCPRICLWLKCVAADTIVQEGSLLLSMFEIRDETR